MMETATRFCRRAKHLATNATRGHALSADAKGVQASGVPQRVPPDARSSYLKHHPPLRSRQAFAEFLQRFQVQIERLASVGEGLGEGRPARDDLGDVGKINLVGDRLRPIVDGEYIAAISVRADRHWSRTPSSFLMSSGWQVL